MDIKGESYVSMNKSQEEKNRGGEESAVLYERVNQHEQSYGARGNRMKMTIVLSMR